MTRGEAGLEEKARLQETCHISYSQWQAPWLSSADAIEFAVTIYNMI